VSLGATERQTAALGIVFVVQVAAAVFFVADVLTDVSLDGLGPHLVLEAIVTAALLAGVVFGGREMRRAIERASRSEAAVAAAQGALGQVIRDAFARWRLTPAEAEVALLALKGFEIAEIARLRGAAQGTVRAQLTRIYAKAGVSSRAELLSIFMEELLGGDIVHRAVATGA
jgi:DNA-binding CsgD family transcriptional regulator